MFNAMDFFVNPFESGLISRESSVFLSNTCIPLALEHTATTEIIRTTERKQSSDLVSEPLIQSDILLESL